MKTKFFDQELIYYFLEKIVEFEMDKFNAF